ncbi:MAG: hypothetical protein ACKOS8_06055 [Gemmataceae bacterium]
MTSSIFMLAATLATQSGNQSGTITNDTTVKAGMPYSIVEPKGNGTLAGQITSLVVNASAGSFDNGGNFVLDNNLPGGTGSINYASPTSINWFRPSFMKPNYSFTQRAVLSVYKSNPPVISTVSTSDKYIP